MSALFPRKTLLTFEQLKIHNSWMKTDEHFIYKIWHQMVEALKILKLFQKDLSPIVQFLLIFINCNVTWR